MSSKEELLAELTRCVLEMDDTEITDVAERYVAFGHDPLDGILLGLVEGMNKAAELYEQEEYFIPELLICSDAMYNGLGVLRPLLPQGNFGGKGKALIGVVQGDTHDIGKNLVKIMLESAGYQVTDLGRDVPADSFIARAQEMEPDILCLSTLMSTSMNNMKRVIEQLEEARMRERVKVMIGGGPISQAFADKIGADAYATNAIEAVKTANRLLGVPA